MTIILALLNLGSDIPGILYAVAMTLDAAIIITAMLTGVIPAYHP